MEEGDGAGGARCSVSKDWKGTGQDEEEHGDEGGAECNCGDNGRIVITDISIAVAIIIVVVVSSEA